MMMKPEFVSGVHMIHMVCGCRLSLGQDVRTLKHSDCKEVHASTKDYRIEKISWCHDFEAIAEFMMQLPELEESVIWQ
jgi:hypothetical protein